MGIDEGAQGRAIRETRVPERPVRTCWPQPRLASRSGCCITPTTPPDRPDLATYSQDEQFVLGNAPTWDSPDILTNFWNPFRLMPESEVWVRNLSPTASAVNAQVLLSAATFGIGQPWTLLGSQIVNLAPGQEAHLKFPLPQNLLNAVDQRVAVQVKIVHPYDTKLVNNRGSQLLADAYTSKSGRSFSVQFPVVNPVSQSQQLTLSVLPNALGAVVAPAARLFAPLEQVMATLTVHVPPALHGTVAAPVRTDVTVAGRDATGTVIGGLTYVIWVDN